MLKRPCSNSAVVLYQERRAMSESGIARYQTGVDGTVIDIRDASVLIEEPNWAALEALLVQAEKWVLKYNHDDNRALELEPITLLYGMLFWKYGAHDQQVRGMLFYFRQILKYVHVDDEALSEPL
jgi:hypothetical protein